MKATVAERSTPPARAESSRPLLLAGLAVCLAVGAFVRLAHLGKASLGADEINFLRLCSQPVTFASFFDHWMQWMGISGQFPFPMAAIKGFVNVTGLTADAFGLRLLSAIWGILAIPVAYLLGRELRDGRLGLAMAAVLALHPVHIQMSREAYYYVPLILGSFLMAAGTAALVRAWRQGGRPAAWGSAAHGLGFFLLTWSQPTGWPMAAILLLADVVALIGLGRRKAVRMTMLFAWLLPVVVIGLPLLSSEWALPHLIKNASGATKASALKALAVMEGSPSVLLQRAVGSLSFGGTPVRFALSIALLLAGLAFTVKRRKADPVLVLLPLALVLFVILFLVSRAVTGAGFELRYINALIPVHVALLGCGLLLLDELLPRKGVLGIGLLGVAGLMAYPAWLCTHLQGSPVPYRDIVEWCDAHLSLNAPVLTDRWLDPGNELHFHPGTNVIFTFTLPNEPVDVFLQTRWRDGARQFCERFPDAAYAEINKEYWHVPSVGPWQWPREFFAQHGGVTNVAGVELRHLGLAARGDFYWSNTNRLITEIFYNTREDVMKARAKAGMSAFVYYGPGWGYTKTQDYRDWRVLRDRASLELINLTAAPLTAKLMIRGVAIGESKEIIASQGGQKGFPPNQLVEWVTEPIQLQPGINRVELRDPRGGASRQPFLLDVATLMP